MTRLKEADNIVIYKILSRTALAVVIIILAEDVSLWEIVYFNNNPRRAKTSCEPDMKRIVLVIRL